MRKKEQKSRIDQLLVEAGLATDISRARALVLAGDVFVGTHKVLKPGEEFLVGAQIRLKSKRPHVSRGGDKLSYALCHFKISVTDKICADIGSSTGGFTDVLLQSGAAKVFAIDSAYGELDWKLRSNERVVVMERTNILQLDELPEPVDLITVDVSLLSIRKFVPKIAGWLGAEGKIVALIKPQYEASKEELPPGAVITKPEVHRCILQSLLIDLEAQEISTLALIPSPILGGSGNKEFLALLGKREGKATKIENLIEHALML